MVGIVQCVSAADLSVEFVPYDPNDPRQDEKLQRVAAIIKEKQISVGLKGFKKPGEVVEALKSRVPFKVNTDTHTRAWKCYGVRPHTGSANPEKTKAQIACTTISVTCTATLTPGSICSPKLYPTLISTRR